MKTQAQKSTRFAKVGFECLYRSYCNEPSNDKQITMQSRVTWLMDRFQGEPMERKRVKKLTMVDKFGSYHEFA